MADQVEDKDKTIAGLKDENSKLKAASTTLQTENTGLKKENETLKTSAVAKDKDLEQAATAIGKLKEQLAQKELETVKLPTVKVGGKTYELVGGDFMYGGKEVSIEVLNEDATLAAELVKERVGNLRLLEAKK